jgi:hypothetical protein
LQLRVSAQGHLRYATAVCASMLHADAGRNDGGDGMADINRVSAPHLTITTPPIYMHTHTHAHTHMQALEKTCILLCTRVVQARTQCVCVCVPQFLSGIMSSLVPPGAQVSVVGGTTTTTTFPFGGPLPRPDAAGRDTTGRAGTGAARDGVPGDAAAAGPFPGGGPQLTLMVPHLLTTVEAYLRRLQAPDFQPRPVPLYALAPAPGN